MPDIDPDMKDLMKRASEEYPLKEGPDKWEEIDSRLSADSPVPESPQTPLQTEWVPGDNGKQ